MSSLVPSGHACVWPDSMHLKERLKGSKGLLDVGEEGRMCVYVIYFLHLPELLVSSSNSVGPEMNLKIPSYLARGQVSHELFAIFIECVLRGFSSSIFL